MEPQNNNEQQNPNPNIQSMDGFGGVSASYENFNDRAADQGQEAQAQAQDPGAVPMNVVNMVNANGVVSGKKVVDSVWQRLAISTGIVAGGLLIGLIIAVMIVMQKNADVTVLQREKKDAESTLNNLYQKMGVSDFAGAISQLDKTEILSGGDLYEVNTKLADKFGANFRLDLADSNINFVVRNGVYKVVSLGVYRESGTMRVILYEKIANGEWKLGGFNAQKHNACEDSTEEEKAAISGVIACEEDAESK